MRDCWEYSPSKRPKCEYALVKIEKIVEQIEQDKKPESPVASVSNTSTSSNASSNGSGSSSSATPSPVLTPKKEEGKKDDSRLELVQGKNSAGASVLASTSSPKSGHGVNWRNKFSGVINPEHFKKSKKKLKHIPDD